MNPKARLTDRLAAIERELLTRPELEREIIGRIIGTISAAARPGRERTREAARGDWLMGVVEAAVSRSRNCRFPTVGKE